MNTLLLFYGLFLMGCGIASVIFIGPKAKTALLSGGSAGLLAICIGYFYSLDSLFLVIGAAILPFLLFIVFSWRATKTFIRLIELITLKDPETTVKAIAFLIIGLMAIVSIVVFILQVVVIPCIH